MRQHDEAVDPSMVAGVAGVDGDLDFRFFAFHDETYGGFRMSMISSTSAPIGISNLPFDVALQKRDESGDTHPFNAYVIHTDPRRSRK